MNALINILMNSLSSMLWGIFLTILGIALMFVLIRLWWKKGSFTPFSFLIGGILFFFLSFQSILLCAAITIRSNCDEVEYLINKMVSTIPSDVVFSQEESQNILDEINVEWPLVGYYVNIRDFQGHTSGTIASASINELRSSMNYFILRRIGWSFLFVVIGAMIVIKTISSRKSSGRRKQGSIKRSRVGIKRQLRTNNRY